MKKEEDKDLEAILPEVTKTMKSVLNGEDFNTYEKTITNVTKKAITALESIIDDETLKLDPEQMVRSVQVLTKAKIDIIEAKRKLLETCVKGEVMIKALEQPKDKNESSVLLDYLEKNKLDTEIDKTGTTPSSIFESIAEKQE